MSLAGRDTRRRRRQRSRPETVLAPEASLAASARV